MSRHCINFVSTKLARANRYNEQKRKFMSNILLLFNLGTGEIIIIAIVVLLLFGGRKIPELMRGIGKGVREFKKGINDVKDEIDKPVEEENKEGKK